MYLETPNWDPGPIPLCSPCLPAMGTSTPGHGEASRPHGRGAGCPSEPDASPPSWRKPQKQSRSQLCSEGNVFALFLLHETLWPVTQAVKHPEAPRGTHAASPMTCQLQPHLELLLFLWQLLKLAHLHVYVFTNRLYVP